MPPRNSEALIESSLPETLDTSGLAQYLSANLDDFAGPVVASKFDKGQSNPTYLLEAASGKYVLRRRPPGELLKSAHAVDREYRVVKALADTDVPVAQVYHLCEDESVLGSIFYVMEYINGRSFRDPGLTESSSAERSSIYNAMSVALAAIHDVDIDKVGLSDFGRPGNYFARQVNRWSKQYKATETESIDAMDHLITWLAENMPDDDGQVSLVHGDYRLDNIIFHPQQAVALAVIDWELSTLGHPYADLAYQCMQWRTPYEEDGLLFGLGALDRSSLGIPTEEEYVEQYCRRRGLDSIDNWNFYLVFSFFKLAGILQGVYKRGLEGNASNEKARLYGSVVAPLAEMAVALL